MGWLGLQGRGSRFFCPLCQPHGGKTPDLSVRDKGFTCHKCGEKGDLLKLIEVAGNMDFPSAVAFLENSTGILSPGRRNKGTHRRDQGPGGDRSTWGILRSRFGRSDQSHGVRT